MCTIYFTCFNVWYYRYICIHCSKILFAYDSLLLQYINMFGSCSKHESGELSKKIYRISTRGVVIDFRKQQLVAAKQNLRFGYDTRLLADVHLQVLVLLLRLQENLYNENANILTTSACYGYHRLL